MGQHSSKPHNEVYKATMSVIDVLKIATKVQLYTDVSIVGDVCGVVLRRTIVVYGVHVPYSTV